MWIRSGKGSTAMVKKIEGYLGVFRLLRVTGLKCIFCSFGKTTNWFKVYKAKKYRYSDRELCVAEDINLHVRVNWEDMKGEPRGSHEKLKLTYPTTAQTLFVFSTLLKFAQACMEMTLAKMFSLSGMEVYEWRQSQIQYQDQDYAFRIYLILQLRTCSCKPSLTHS